MNPLTLATLAGPAAAPLALGMAVVGGIAQVFGGISAKKQAELDAFNVQTQGVMARAEAKERSNARAEQWRTNESQNIALFSAMGRDVSNSQSVSAFLEKQKETAAKDISTSDFMGYMEQMKMRQEAGRLRTEGRAAQTAGWIGGLTSITTGLSDFSEVRVSKIDAASEG